MPYGLFKAFGKMLDIRHSYFFGHFTDGYWGGLQKYDCHVHLIVQYILVQGQSGIFQNQRTEIIFVIIKFFCNFSVGKGEMVMAVDILEYIFGFFLINALLTGGGKAGCLSQNIF